MNEGSAKQQIVEAIKANSNILVTVSDSPSVDELSAALGLTLLLNKIEKRATAIFSGAIPPAITFLDPEKTFEGTVDSLRDFIIALDKEKADHLRYKVDGDVVKIFITPYRTTLSDKDLQFSQGDYNVEMVIALSVKDQDHLDKALAAHGRILHDATVATISVGETPNQMGSIDWRDAAASSLCEMLLSLSDALRDDDSGPIINESVATAYLTGIVSATDRFSNDRTSPRVMTMAAQLMAAGANQQLIAAKLQEGHDIGPTANRNKNASDGNDGADDTAPKNDRSKKEKKKKDDHSLTIERESKPGSKKEIFPIGEKPEQQADVAETAVAVEEALEQAEPAKDIEKELAEQLADVTPSIPAPSSDPANLEKELNEALATDVPVETAAPEFAAVPAPAPEPAPSDEAPATITTDDGMPGFEALEAPVSTPPPTIDSFAVPVADSYAPTNPSFDTRPGSSYIEPAGKAGFDAIVEPIIAGSTSSQDQYVDPFNQPLAPLPDLHESKDVSPITGIVAESDQATPPPANVVADPQDALTIEELERTSVPPLPPLDLPPLPPLPDLSDVNLPPLPPPPPPPVFDQPAMASVGQPSGAISSDKLGDIFGDAPAQPEAPVVATEPPKPGQFRIPGQ